MTTLPLGQRVALAAFWLTLVTAVFVGLMALSHIMVGTGVVTYKLASHDECGQEYECYDEGGYRGDGGDQEYDQWNNEDRNRNRNRNRGAFSPGPFDRSPIDFTNACISLDCSGRDEGKRNDRQPPEEER